MRDLFRLIAIAVMSFVVVGVAMVYSRGGDIGTTFQALSQGVSGVAQDVGQMLGPDAVAAETKPEGHALSLARLDNARWVGLAGFPDQTEVSFPLPRGGQYLSGALDLVFDTQLTEHGDGLMTLSVNGTQRGQVVLDAGRATHQVRIALVPADLLGDRVVLHMAGRGTTNSGQICPTDAANSGSAVTLSADSRLNLEASEPLSDAIGALVVAPRPLVLSGQGEEDMALTVWASQQLNRSGLATRLGLAGMGETAVLVSGNGVAMAAGMATGNVLVGSAAVNQLAKAAGMAPLPQAWPVGVADLGAETTVKTFRNSRRWTIPFAAADLPQGALPEQFNLRLKTTPLAGNNDWMVRVSLNGNLVETRRLAGTADTIALDIALPEARLLPRNSLVVELVDTTPNEGICTRAPDAQAQLLPESSLVDTATASLDWAQLIEGLAKAPSVSLVVADGLSQAQAGRASDMLATILPRGAVMDFGGQGAVKLMVTSASGLGQAMAGLDQGATISAVLPVTGAAGATLSVLPVPGPTLGAALDALGQDDVVIIASGL